MGRGKIVIGYPHGGSVRTEFHESLMKFQRHDFFNAHILDSGMSAGGCLLEDNREALAQGFLEYQGSNQFAEAPQWLVCLDTDIKFEPEIIYGLLEMADPIERPIVSALYYTTISNNFTACWLKRNTEDNDYQTFIKVDVGLNRINGCGLGCAIIHRSVLEKMESKYREHPFKWFGRDQVQLKKGWTRLGEDITFCARAESLGFSIWGHSEIRVGHIKTREENADTMRERLEAHEYQSLLKQRADLDQQELSKAAVDVFYAKDEKPVYANGASQLPQEWREAAK